jgi:hypothetical protein
MVSQHVRPTRTLRSAGKRIAGRVMSVARSNTATPVNVFMIRCNICGLLKVERRLDQPPSECPLCQAPIAVLAHYRSNSSTRSSIAVSDGRDQGTARALG